MALLPFMNGKIADDASPRFDRFLELPELTTKRNLTVKRRDSTLQSQITISEASPTIRREMGGGLIGRDSSLDNNFYMTSI